MQFIGLKSAFDIILFVKKVDISSMVTTPRLIEVYFLHLIEEFALQ
jgi:hypothetical protein